MSPLIFQPNFCSSFDGWFGVLSYNLIIYRYSINFCLSSRDIYISLSISLSCVFVTVSELFYCEFFETFIILSVILLPIKSPVVSSVFWIIYFEVVLSAPVADCLAWSTSFWLNLPLSHNMGVCVGVIVAPLPAVGFLIINQKR